jgi:hypothetical protein
VADSEAAITKNAEPEMSTRSPIPAASCGAAALALKANPLPPGLPLRWILGSM